jgi:hypothetical protein
VVRGIPTVASKGVVDTPAVAKYFKERMTG